MKNKKLRINSFGMTKKECVENKDGWFWDFFNERPHLFEFVENQETSDLTLTIFFDHHICRQRKPHQKILMISAENIIPKHFKFDFHLDSRIFKTLFYVAAGLLLKKGPFCDFVLRKQMMREMDKPNTYLLIPNAIKRKNILNIPFFFHTHMDKMETLIQIKQENLYTKKTKFCCFIVANHSAKDRISFFKKLSKYKKVDSYGPVLNNAKIPFSLLQKYRRSDITDAELQKFHHLGNYSYAICDSRYALNQELFRDYKFVICFENSFANDYITEKLPNVMMGNAIGIYRGAGNVGEFFNTKSFLNWDDFGSDEKVIEKIIELDKDDAKYQNMLKAPFFVENELPPRIKNANTDFEKFLFDICEK